MPATVELDAQYRQLREECGLLERPGRGAIDVLGPDAAEYLQGQLTNDVEALGVGEGQYAALLDRKGHMQTDLRVLRVAADAILLDTEPETKDAALRHLTMYSIGRDVAVGDATAERAFVSLIGPRAAEVAGTPPLPEFANEATKVAGVDVLAVGTRDGIDLLLPPDERERVVGALLDAGAVEVSPEAVEILRVERGVPRFGAEMDAGTMPAEAAIVEDAVSFTKGCYIGQETVARLHYKGRPNRHLRGLRLSGAAAPGAALRLGDKEVGTLGGAVVSPALGPIGLAIVRREAEPGTQLTVGEDGVTAEVVALPFG
ncbi:MAG TPA: glycine cleavage T C-terminal barrel domain-containing protein [Solirubrobacterales bacterium]|nr:glycine cleavage T C-terminal barrel domain-containing protein [Solirubrobacterales bacterium]